MLSFVTKWDVFSENRLQAQKNLVHVYCVESLLFIGAFMVYPINSINHNQVNLQELEIIRRLQSLGIQPTGNLTTDKQILQQAELAKKQQTLATNSEQNLTRINGTSSDFSATLSNISGVQNVSENGLIENGETSKNSLSQIIRQADRTKPCNMVGATQIGELNKWKLGLIA